MVYLHEHDSLIGLTAQVPNDTRRGCATENRRRPWGSEVDCAPVILNPIKVATISICGIATEVAAVKVKTSRVGSAAQRIRALNI